jgi:hypothetical protein
MDSHYIINRLKASPYIYQTVALMQTRLNQLDEESKEEILINLKKQIHKECNLDIKQPLAELVYHIPIV